MDLLGSPSTVGVLNELIAKFRATESELAGSSTALDDGSAKHARPLVPILNVLAILKAGGSFMPLDPDDPTLRKEMLIVDTDAKSGLLNSFGLVTQWHLLLNRSTLPNLANQYADRTVPKIPPQALSQQSTSISRKRRNQFDLLVERRVARKAGAPKLPEARSTGNGTAWEGVREPQRDTPEPGPSTPSTSKRRSVEPHGSSLLSLGNEQPIPRLRPEPPPSSTIDATEKKMIEAREELSKLALRFRDRFPRSPLGPKSPGTRINGEGSHPFDESTHPFDETTHPFDETMHPFDETTRFLDDSQTQTQETHPFDEDFHTQSQETHPFDESTQGPPDSMLDGMFDRRRQRNLPRLPRADSSRTGPGFLNHQYHLRSKSAANDDPFSSPVGLRLSSPHPPIDATIPDDEQQSSLASLTTSQSGLDATIRSRQVRREAVQDRNLRSHDLELSSSSKSLKPATSTALRKVETSFQTREEEDMEGVEESQTYDIEHDLHDDDREQRRNSRRPSFGSSTSTASPAVGIMARPLGLGFAPSEMDVYLGIQVACEKIAKTHRFQSDVVFRVYQEVKDLCKAEEIVIGMKRAVEKDAVERIMKVREKTERMRLSERSGEGSSYWDRDGGQSQTHRRSYDMRDEEDEDEDQENPRDCSSFMSTTLFFDKLWKMWTELIMWESRGIRSPVVTHSKKPLLPLPQLASTMLSCPAEGCTFRAKSDRALTTHIGKCKKAAAGLASIAEEIGQHEAEGHRQPKRRRILSPEHPEVMVDVEETAYVDCEIWHRGQHPPGQGKETSFTNTPSFTNPSGRT
ncbi:hypothetical protein BJ322DRAFT_1021260 [Thelephora terrestris]|uniref:Uncharacterized protein n=1 Tax=Thelephora terrestris TaxID=56493 RepID=A0A9P6L6L5_9AGAM|nr:hypothetical protein BJ322DRAFT_1021260 [Thelephora terrestris]